jgi:hypothetical protein
MKYLYSPIYPPHADGYLTTRPLIEITIVGNDRIHKEIALLDSGADLSVFNVEIAELVGIDLSHARCGRLEGIIGGQDIFITDIAITAPHLDEPITIPAGFIESAQVSALLGQRGFFDQHTILFEKHHDAFTVSGL